MPAWTCQRPEAASLAAVLKGWDEEDKKKRRDGEEQADEALGGNASLKERGIDGERIGEGLVIQAPDEIAGDRVEKEVGEDGGWKKR